MYFSNLKSYLLISYVSPPRLGIFTETIVSARAAPTVPMRKHRAIPILSGLYFFSPSASLSLWRALDSFFFNRARCNARGKLRETNGSSILTSVIVLVYRDSGSNPCHYVDIGSHSFERAWFKTVTLSLSLFLFIS